METIEIKGDNLLNDNEKFELNKILESYKEKIQWKTKSDYILKIVVKKYSADKADKKDTKAKYSFQAMIKGQTQTFEASVEDWDFNKSLHRLFEKLMTEIEHAYHSSEQRNSGKNKAR